MSTDSQNTQSHVPDPAVYEKLGAFYLGREVEPASGEVTDRVLLYDSKDLTTHALCVGMTGSGKTGLCISLLEEAAIDGIPALIVDPKGDLGNLLLTFPDLAPADFEPWVEDEEAASKGLTRSELAARQAELWKNGLAQWGQSGERIARLRQSVDLRLLTPGSEAGTPVSILASFAAPPPALLADADLFRERIHTLTASLLSLLGIDADPVKSREYILLSNLFDTLWRQGQSLDLAGLVQAVQNPPLQRVGVLELESFYPAKERFGLALALNNLLAAPTFQAWMKGEPLDVDRLLYGPDGKPRVSILHIAHLSEAERMFFVSLLLNQTLGWVRSRPGTSSLRAILYMDEIFGFLPPVAEPPSKRPLLTLLKQARAFGLGVVLATQNPVDVDYKALSNMGTWFLGRLQTERDQQRVLDGLQGASGGGLDRGELERLLAGLGKRVFLLHNVHEKQPLVFQTRWAMSYLRGPLTRQQIQRLAPPASLPAAPGAGGSPAAPVPPAAARAAAATARPVLPPGVPELFLPDPPPPGSLWEPWLLGLARVSFADRKAEVDHREEVALCMPLPADAGNAREVGWRDARDAALDPQRLEREPPSSDAGFAALPAAAADAKSYRGWEKDLSDVLYRERRLELFRSPALGETSRPGEDERDFRIRLADTARQRRDEQVQKLREGYASRFSRLEDQELKARQAVEREEQQARQSKLDTLVQVGSTVASLFFGRRVQRSASSAVKGVGRSFKEHGDVGRAEERLEAVREKRRELEEKLAEEIDRLEERFDPLGEELETVAVEPRRSDVEVERVALLWAPAGWGGSGVRRAAG